MYMHLNVAPCCSAVPQRGWGWAGHRPRPDTSLQSGSDRDIYRLFISGEYQSRISVHCTYMYTYIHTYMYKYRNLSTKDTTGTSRSVLYYKRLISTAMYYTGTLRRVPIMEVSLFQSVIITDVPQYYVLGREVPGISVHAVAPLHVLCMEC